MLPNRSRIAVWVGINIEHFNINITEFGGVQSFHVKPPNVFDYSLRDYGNRVGFWRLLELLDKYQIKASVLLNSDVCKHNPQIIEHAKEKNWEFLGHGTSNSITLNGLDEDHERKIIRKSLDTIFKETGQKPTGWLGPALQETFNTPDILAEEGVRYLCDWCCDDQPFVMKVRKGTLISVPYTVELNDYKLFLFQNFKPNEYFNVIKDHFDTLYQEGSNQARVMCLGLHPFIIGQPFRIKYFERVLQYIKKHENVWLTTAGEIASWYYENYINTDKS
jgi:peptidoglycan/xylan/chitin deacetylase (PgdA/CDA1 family)